MVSDEDGAIGRDREAGDGAGGLSAAGDVGSADGDSEDWFFAAHFRGAEDFVVGSPDDFVEGQVDFSGEGRGGPGECSVGRAVRDDNFPFVCFVAWFPLNSPRQFFPVG